MHKEQISGPVGLYEFGLKWEEFQQGIATQTEVCNLVGQRLLE
jgi:hypothetical protein